MQVEIEQQLRARQLALAMRSQMVLSPEDEEVLWWLLQRHAALPLHGATVGGEAEGEGGGEGGGGQGFAAGGRAGELSLNYDDFTQVAAECREAIGPNADLYFQASTFLRLARDAGGSVPVAALFRYCTARSALLQLRVELGVADAAGSGSLSPAQLRGWLEGRAPLSACSQALVSEADWCTAVQARLLLLHGRRGRVPLWELVGSPEGQQLAVALHAWDAADAAAAAAANAAADGEDSMGGVGGSAAALAAAAAAAARQAGWAAPASVAALRLRFAELDADGDGLLSPEEFSGFSQGTMTPLFIQRLFAQHCSAGGAAAVAGGDGGRSGAAGAPAPAPASPGAAGAGGARMDFAAFAAFAAAWEQRHRPAATRYFFQVLDLRGAGYLTQAELYTFFREVHGLWIALGQYAELRIEDVLAEVNDLLQAPDPQRITPADLQRSGAAGTVIGLLADVNLFWEYENREALLQQQQAAAAAAGGAAQQ